MSSTHPEHQAGTPSTRSPIRTVKPARTVLIDLGALCGREAHFRRPNVLMTPTVATVVTGELDAWVLTDTGWFGACRYQIKLAYGQYVEQSHLVPGWALRPTSQ